MYMSSLIWNWISTRRLVWEARNGLFSQAYDPYENVAAFQQEVQVQSILVTVALGINVSICNHHRGCRDVSNCPQVAVGDAIVWWRACVIWRSKIIYCIGPIIITITLSLCFTQCLCSVADTLPHTPVLGTVGACTNPTEDVDDIMVMFNSRNPLVIAATVLSLTTNVSATFLIAYKAL